MDDFLYIIIGIIWVVYSLYSSKQKQQKKRALEEANRNESPKRAPAPRSFLEELLGGEVIAPAKPEAVFEEYQEPEFNYPVEAQSAETIVSKNQSLESIVEEVSASYFDEEISQRRNAARSMSENISNLRSDEAETSVYEEEEFDLRKAVIYSEILNPRYI